MKQIIFFILLLIIIGGCKNAKPKTNILPLDSMKTVMFDFLIADEWNNIRSATDTVFLKSKNNLKAYQQVLVIHHIDKTIFDSSLSYYEQRPDIFKILMDSVNAYGARLQNNATPKPEPAKTRLKKPMKKL